MATVRKQADDKGIFHSIIFPGLWIDGIALLQSNYQQAQGVLNQGIDSPAHQAFVMRLASFARDA